MTSSEKVTLIINFWTDIFTVNEFSGVEPCGKLIDCWNAVLHFWSVASTVVTVRSNCEVLKQLNDSFIYINFSDR